jgi:hypothetical protein
LLLLLPLLLCIPAVRSRCVFTLAVTAAAPEALLLTVDASELSQQQQQALQLRRQVTRRPTAQLWGFGATIAAAAAAAFAAAASLRV